MPLSWPASTSSPATSTSHPQPIKPTSSVSPAPSTSCTQRSGARPDEPPVPLPADPRLLARAEILNLTTDAGDLDITSQPDGTHGYDDLKQHAHPQPLGGGLYIAIASLQDIIRSKTAAGRAKDLATLPQLHAALQRKGDSADHQ